MTPSYRIFGDTVSVPPLHRCFSIFVPFFVASREYFHHVVAYGFSRRNTHKNRTLVQLVSVLRQRLCTRACLRSTRKRVRWYERSACTHETRLPSDRVITRRLVLVSAWSDSQTSSPFSPSLCSLLPLPLALCFSILHVLRFFLFLYPTTLRHSRFSLFNLFRGTPSLSRSPRFAGIFSSLSFVLAHLWLYIQCSSCDHAKSRKRSTRKERGQGGWERKKPFKGVYTHIYTQARRQASGCWLGAHSA